MWFFDLITVKLGDVYLMAQAHGKLFLM